MTENFPKYVFLTSLIGQGVVALSLPKYRCFCGVIVTLVRKSICARILNDIFLYKECKWYLKILLYTILRTLLMSKV